MTEQRRRRNIDDVDIDPDEALAADAEDDHNRDPGADLDAQGVPADDRTSMGSVPEPERPVAPTDEPVAASELGTTEREQVAGEPMEDKLDAERPDEPPAEDAPPEEERLGDRTPERGDERP